MVVHDIIPDRMQKLLKIVSLSHLQVIFIVQVTDNAIDMSCYYE